jgi:hypothetical protein
MNKTKNILNTKVVPLDIKDGEGLIVALNKQDARNNWITEFDKVELKINGSVIVVDADLSIKLIKPGQIGVFTDVQKNMG